MLDVVNSRLVFVTGRAVARSGAISKATHGAQSCDAPADHCLFSQFGGNTGSLQ